MNFSREEWQQALRTNQDPKALKRTFQECWAISDSRKAFAQALLSRGFALARGDRRGFVAVDYRGEVYAIARYTGIRTKQVSAKLGDPKNLPSIEEAKANIGTQMSEKLRGFLQQTRKEQEKQSATLAFQRTQMVARQRDERQKLKQKQEQRWDTESQVRSERLAKGLRGIWHRLSGKYERVKRQNECETLEALRRDRVETDALIFEHVVQRQELQANIRQQRKTHLQELRHMRKELFRYFEMKDAKTPELRKQFQKASRHKPNRLKKNQTRNHDPEFGPEI